MTAPSQPADVNESIAWLKAYAYTVDCIDPESPSRAASNLREAAATLQALKDENERLHETLDDVIAVLDGRIAGKEQVSGILKEARQSKECGA